MIVVVRDKNGNERDVTSIYIKALEGTITNEEYQLELNKITGK